MQPLAGSHTIGTFCELVGGLDLFPAEPVREVSRLYRRWAYESAALDLALRQQGIPLTEALGREAQARHVRRVAAAGRAAHDRSRREPARPLPDAPLQARPDELVDGRAGRGAGRDRRDRLGGLQGPVQGHRRRPAARPRALREGDRGLPRRVDRGPGADRRDEPDPRAPPRPDHVGCADPLDRRHRGAALPAEDGEREAVAGRVACGRCWTPTTGARSVASRPMAAGSGSSAAGAARSSTWHRSSTRMRPTT